MSDEGEIDLTSSKSDFRLCFRYLITRKTVPSDEAKEQKKTIANLKRFVDNMEEREFCKIWSNNFFYHDYILSLKDIDELLEWVWDNRDFFDEAYLVNFALSIYNACDETPFEEVARRKSA